MSDQKPAKNIEVAVDESDNEERYRRELNKKLIGLEAKLLQYPGQSAAKAMSKVLWGANSEAAEEPLVEGLKAQRKLLRQGDLSGIEAMLLDQANVLDAMFNRYVIAGAKASHFDHFDEFYRTALKAQNHCRRTIATLVDLRSPKRSATFIKQQNVGINQQINDGNNAIEFSEKKINPANELLEENHESRLDIRTEQETSGSDSKLEAVEKIDRAPHGKG